jgi:hypothetical protein
MVDGSGERRNKCIAAPHDGHGGRSSTPNARGANVPVGRLPWTVGCDSGMRIPHRIRRPPRVIGCTANGMNLFNIAHRRMTIYWRSPVSISNVGTRDADKRWPRRSTKKGTRVMRGKQFVMLTALLVGATSTTATAQQGVGGALSAPIGGPPAPTATPGATSGVNPNTGFGSSSAGGSAGTSTGPTNPNSSGAISGMGKTNPRQ